MFGRLLPQAQYGMGQPQPGSPRAGFGPPAPAGSI